MPQCVFRLQTVWIVNGRVRVPGEDGFVRFWSGIEQLVQSLAFDLKGSDTRKILEIEYPALQEISLGDLANGRPTLCFPGLDKTVFTHEL
jgi:hypothetical protein